MLPSGSALAPAEELRVGGAVTTIPVQTRPHPGAFVEAVRRKQGLSGRALAQKARMSSGYISKLETGDIEPSFGHFARLAVALELNPWEVWVMVRVAGNCHTGGAHSQQNLLTPEDEMA